LRNEEVLLRVKEARNILHAIKRMLANWVGHMLHRNCRLKHVTEGKIEGRMQVTERQGRRRKQLLNNLKKMRGYRKLKEEALYCSLWKTCFARDYGTLVREKNTAQIYGSSTPSTLQRNLEHPPYHQLAVYYNQWCL